MIEQLKKVLVMALAIFLAFMVDSYVGISTILAPKPATAAA